MDVILKLFSMTQCALNVKNRQANFPKTRKIITIAYPITGRLDRKTEQMKQAMDAISVANPTPINTKGSE